MTLLFLCSLLIVRLVIFMVALVRSCCVYLLSLPDNIQLYAYTTIYFSIPLLIDSVASSLGQLETKLL